MVEVKQLTKQFKSGTGVVVALDDVSFEVPSGQFVAIVGRSGSGKSTLLYQMSALDSPTSGSIAIDNTIITALPDDERTKFRLTSLGYIFQDYANIPSLTSLENVMAPLLMHGATMSAARERAAEALDRVGLGDRINSLPAQLSGGQQQRVSIARAIVHHPKILFADEPTANLDSETSRSVLDVFLELHREGQTIVMVTHEPEYAKLCDREIELSDGRLMSDRLTR